MPCIVTKASLLLTLSLIGNCFAFAQGPSRDPQAITIVQNAITALGGAVTTSQISDTTAQGTFQAGSGTGTFTWQTQGAEFRYSTQTNTDTRIFVSGHGAPADVRNGVGVTTGTHVLRSTLPYHVPGLALLQEINNANYSMTFVGPETLNGTSVIHVQTVDNSDTTGSQVTPQDWYFDAGTMLPVRVGHRIPDSADPTNYITATRDFGPYTNVGGVLVPTSITTTINGAPRSVTIAPVQFNTGLSPSTFDAPNGGGQ